MGRRGRLSRCLTSLCFLTMVYHKALSECPLKTCEEGLVFRQCQCVRCPDTDYWVMKHNLALCNRCTENCSPVRNLIEVRSCNVTHNRICHCRKGYFCSSLIQYTCRRCKECQEGTFSSEPNNRGTCTPHANCMKLGMVMVSKGNKTHDNQCARLSTTPLPHLPVISSTQSTSTPSADTRSTLSGPKSLSSGKKQTSTVSAGRNVSQSIEPAPPYTITANGLVLARLKTTATIMTAQPMRHELGSLIILPLLICCMLLIALLLAFCTWHRRKKMKFLMGHLGVKFLNPETNRKENQHDSSSLGATNALLPHSTPRVEGTGPSSGSLQHVFVDNSGSKETVSNAIGSIIIYSPGTVVLGTNSSKCMEPGEQKGLISNPHQESSSSREGVPPIQCIQEEGEENLSYPVPATGK